MSQVHIIDIEGGFPQIPTTFTADSGSAVPLANNLEILGDTALAGSIPVTTVGSGNTITVVTQLSQAIAASDPTKVGLAAFNSANFDVDVDGFVSLIGGSATVSGTATTIGAVTADVISVDLLSVKGTFTFRISIAAYCSASTGSDVDLGNGYTITGSVRTNGVTATQIGLETRDEFEEIAGATVNLIVSGNNGIIRVTGAANDTIKWKATGDYVFVPFNQ